MENKKKRKFSIILAASFAVLLIGYFSVSIGLRGRLADKKDEYSSLSEEYESVSAENENAEYLLESADELELYEHLARERGYVYPDETIYYDVTPGN